MRGKPYAWLAGLLALTATCAQAAEDNLLPEGIVRLPDNQWVKVGDVPPDPLGRELEPGRGAFFCYEPNRGVFLRYGGYTPTDCNALWTYSLPDRRWENPLKTDYAWPPPTHRPGAGAWWSMARDTKRGVVWFFGGSGLVDRTHGHLVNDIWRYDPATGEFTAMNSKNAPSHSAGTRLAYDAQNDVIVRAPGADNEWANRHNRDRTWVYNPESNAWEGRATPNSPKRTGLALAWVFDPETGKTVYVQNDSRSPASETWTFDAANNAWEKLVTSEAPPGVVVPGACYDAHNRLIVLYGGVSHPGKGYGYLHRGGGVQTHETWTLNVARAEWRKRDVGAPTIPKLPGERAPRFEIVTAMDYDAERKAIVLAAPTIGVWALRLRTEGAPPLPDVSLSALPPFDPPSAPDRVFPQAPPNPKLTELDPGTWLKLDGGRTLGGGEIPLVYDESTGYLLKYGGCNNGGTTFASGYGNDLSAYDPATERWIGLRWVDPCGPPRQGNGCTLYSAYDPVRQATWFAGGTSGNHLSSSLPPDGSGGAGIWRYDGLRDRFERTPVKTGMRVGAGVVTAYDRHANLFLCAPKAYAQGVFGFSPETGEWRQLTREKRAEQYTYACYADSIRAMLVVELSDDGPHKTLAFDSAAGTWTDREPGGVPLTGKGRPALAYDPHNDVVLCVLGKNAYVYRVRANVWEKFGDEGAAPAISEMMVFDRRHRVFLGTQRGGDMWAFRAAGEGD